MEQISEIERLSKKLNKMLKTQKLMHKKLMLDKMQLKRDEIPTKRFLQEEIKNRTSIICENRKEELARATEIGLVHRTEVKYNEMVLGRQNILMNYRQKCDEYAYAAYGRAETLVRRCIRRKISPIHEKIDQGNDPINFLCATTQRLTLDQESPLNSPVCLRSDLSPKDISSRPALPLSQETGNPPKRCQKHHLVNNRKSCRHNALLCHSQWKKSVVKDKGVQTGKTNIRPGTKRRLGRLTRLRTC